MSEPPAIQIDARFSMLPGGQLRSKYEWRRTMRKMADALDGIRFVVVDQLSPILNRLCDDLRAILGEPKPKHRWWRFWRR